MEPKTFADLGLSTKVQQAIATAGYANPTPIQAEAIPVAMTGRDVLGIAQTGTGKTASFTLPMISRLETGRARARMPRSLILAPTRELAAQVADSFTKYGINHKLDVALLIGGVSMDEQTKKLDRGVDVLIATPGRLLDHFQRGRVMLMGVEILVIDEADRMLDMGFIPDIEKICKLLPPRRQTLFFSATMPPEITRLVHQFQNDPVRVEVAPPATTAKTIKQAFAYCPEGEDWHKRELLRELLRAPEVRNAIIFANRKVDVAILLKSLVKHGFNAGAIHGDMDQKSRMETLDKFRGGEIKVLVGSDVAARGLDIPDVSHVFNYDLPRDKDDYVHRIGRTGRAGKEGHAYSIVTPYDLKQLQEIEKMTGDKAAWTGEQPSEQDIADAGKKKRGRGSLASRAPQGRDRNQSRPERGRGPRARAAREGEDAQGPREILNTGQRRAHRGEALPPTAPGLEPQPDVGLGANAEPQGLHGAPGEPAAARQPGNGRHSERNGDRREGQRGHRRGRDRDRNRDPEHREARSGGEGRHVESWSDGRQESRQERPQENRQESRQENRQDRQHDARPPRHEQRDDQRAQPRQQRPAPPRQPLQERSAGSFADNIPAFLQRSVRPVKATSE